jgi:hypothetical protein
MPGLGVCRTGDSFSGTCNAHSNPTAFTGVWGASFISLLTVGGLSVIRVGDQAPTSCGHTAQASTGSTSIIGVPIHRVGDAILVIQGGSGTSITGSSVLTVI